MKNEQRLVRVFLSHTSDMAAFPGDRTFVQAALAAVGRAGMVGVDMGYFAAREGRPAEYCRQRVRESDVYVAVVGFRYGSVVAGDSVSYTELEFQEATATGIPRLVFLVDDVDDLPGLATDADRTAVEGFRRRLREAGLIVRTFTSAAALELEIFHALVETVDLRRPPPPRQLPPGVRGFTGRAAELAKLDGIHRTAGAGSTAVVISALSGTAGVGKTALAVQWAHQVADRFPDGQLYVDLHGYDPDRPMPPAEALALLLGALGVDRAGMPLSVEERCGRYRSLIAGRRMLLVLDNASSEEQVRPLLPGAATVLTVVTSRSRLAGLVARNGAHRVELDVLPLADAVALLRALLYDRVDAEPGAAAELATLCARLPLALRVVAELAVSRPGSRLAALVEELADRRRRLDLLDAEGDPRTAVRAVFSWSYQGLPAAAAALFRLLGLHPWQQLDVYAAAALAGVPVHEARQDLEALRRAYLVQPVHVDRYGMHDLLRAYAEELAGRDPEADRHAALIRVFDHYLAAAAAAMDRLYPAERHRRPSVDPPTSSLPPLDHAPAARAWLDRERPALTAVAEHAAGHGRPGHAVALAATLFRYLDTSGYATDALAMHTLASDAASTRGDASAEGQALINLGSVCWRMGRHDEAATHLERALDLFQYVGDHTGQARALDHRGMLYWRQGRYSPAIDHFQQALILFGEVGDQAGAAYVVDHLGLAYRRLGRYDLAAEHFHQALDRFRQVGNRVGEGYALNHIGMQQALALFRQLGDRGGEAYALDDLGTVRGRQGRHRLAVAHYHRALTLFRQVSDRSGEVGARNGLAVVYCRQGHHGLATDHLRQALTTARQIGDWYGEARALNGLGETLCAGGRHAEAAIEHSAALAVAVDSGDLYEQARAHAGLADSHDAAGTPAEAAQHRRHALAIYTRLQVPEAATPPHRATGD
jgi:tetratricopeptide (TPR) repeat protein